MVTSLPYPDDDTVSQSPIDVTTDSDDYQTNVMNTSDPTDSDITAVPTDAYPILDSISVPHLLQIVNRTVLTVLLSKLDQN